MIEQFDLHQFGRLGQAARQALVGLARRSVAGGVIVHHDDRVGGINQRRAKHITWMRNTFVHTANGDFFNPNQMVASIEQNNAQRFFSQHAHFSAKKGMN